MLEAQLVGTPIDVHEAQGIPNMPCQAIPLSYRLKERLFKRDWVSNNHILQVAEALALSTEMILPINLAPALLVATV